MAAWGYRALNDFHCCGQSLKDIDDYKSKANLKQLDFKLNANGW